MKIILKKKEKLATHLFVVCFARMFFNAASRTRLSGKINSYINENHYTAGNVKGTQSRIQYIANIFTKL